MCSFLPPSRKSCSSTPGRSVTFGQVGLGHKNPRNIFFVGRQYPSFWGSFARVAVGGFFRDRSVTFRAFCDPPSKDHWLCTVVEGCGFVPHQTTQDSTTCSFTEENKTSMSNRIGIFRSILNDTIVALPFSFKIFVFLLACPSFHFFAGGESKCSSAIYCMWLLQPKTNSSSHFPFPSFCLQINAFNPFPNSPKLTDVGLSNLALDLVASAHLIAALGSSQGLLCIHTHIRSNSPGVP